MTLKRYFGGGQAPDTAQPQPVTEGRDASAAAIQDFVFQPARLEVAAGATIVWTNGGQVVHTVSADDGSFESGPIEPGARRAITFTRPGTSHSIVRPIPS